MRVTFQFFANSLVRSIADLGISEKIRHRLIRIVLSCWKFDGGIVRLDEVEAKYGRQLTKAMQRFVAYLIEAIEGILITDRSLKGELWNLSEVAHDIEENRAANVRVIRIKDGPLELPEFEHADA